MEITAGSAPTSTGPRPHLKIPVAVNFAKCQVSVAHAFIEYEKLLVFVFTRSGCSPRSVEAPELKFSNRLSGLPESLAEPRSRGISPSGSGSAARGLNNVLQLLQLLLLLLLRPGRRGR